MMLLSESSTDGALAQILAEPPGSSVSLYWLGQAGFVIDGGGHRLVIDPYLSDSLAEKYRATTYPHTRMMAAPVAPHDIGHVDLVLATHAHTDHLDGATLSPLLTANPRASLLAPAAMADVALARGGIGRECLITMDAGQAAQPLAEVHIRATRAAHEELRRDAAGRHLFLGYGITLAGKTIFHSGDTVPYAGQVEEVAALKADLALLPVNGRDPQRAEQGVPGNLHLSEAVELAANAGIAAMIAHHFDLFTFNTIARAEIDALAAREKRVHLCGARVDVQYRLGQSGP